MKKEKKSSASPIGIVIFLLCLLILVGCSSGGNTIETETAEVTIEPSASDIESQDSSDVEPLIEDTTEEVETPKDFLTALKEDMDEDLAESVYDILTSTVGFENLTYTKKATGTENFEIVADGVDIVVTAFPASDEEPEYIRIFQPNGTTFYDDGELLETADSVREDQEHIQNTGTYYIIAKSIVEDALNTSSKTDFPSSVTLTDVAFGWKDEYVVVQSYVDVKTGAGTYIRYDWTVEFIPTDLDNFEYELVYINIGGDTAGEYVDVN